MYINLQIHSKCVLLILNLILDKTANNLDTRYCSKFPIDDNLPHVIHILHHHLNHPRNYDLVEELLELIKRLKSLPGTLVLLKLLAKSLGNFDNSKIKEKIAEGQFGRIYSMESGFDSPSEIAVKLIPFNNDIHGRCELYDIFTEVSALNILKTESYVSKIYDFGISQNQYFILMKKYSCSLRHWRL